LVGAGFAEIYAYHFIGRSMLEAFEFSPRELIELENPMNPETHYLAAHPAHRFVHVAAENLRHAERASLFGMTSGFRRARKPTLQTPTNEQKYLVIAKAARESNATKSVKGGETFYEAKGVLDRLFETLGVADHWYDDALTNDERRQTKALHPYRTAKVMVGDEYLGIIAELHPETQRRLKAKGRIVFAEIVFEKLWKLARTEAEFTPIGKYPAVIRDIAIIVPENVKADDVEGVIENAGGPLLVDSDLFDYFQDEAMEERGEKSLAFHLIFQSPEKTLTDEEVNRLYRKIVSAVKSKDWEVR
jgi:phenylalanyl-tRNA synthetase beta chain